MAEPNVVRIFQVEKDQTLKTMKMLDTIVPESMSPSVVGKKNGYASIEEMYERVNSMEAYDQAGVNEVWGGLIGFVVIGGVFWYNWGGDLYLLAFCSACLIYTVYKAAYGIYLRAASDRIRRDSAMLRDILEAEEGWLHKYRNLLMDWEKSYPDTVRESLEPTFEASKDRELKDDQQSLIKYWHWVLAVKGRLQIFIDQSDWETKH